MDPLELVTLASLGLVVGALTTVAGLGGGLLIICVAAVFGPRAGLSITAPALLLGHGHRVWLMRRELDARALLPFAVTLASVALIGSALAVGLPDVFLRALLIPLSLIAVVELARGDRGAAATPDRRWLVPGGVGVGLMLAGGGGGGVIAAPVLRRAGLRGDRLVVGLAAGALVGHLARCLAYGWAGTLDATSLLGAATLGGALMLGNLGGRRLARHVGDAGREQLLRAVIGLGLVTAIAQNLAALR